ncbi:ABC transporter substrate-binding protein [Geomonas sp. Red32]|uniref:ABC transporter substrate-binding protein n=1 Tax=Geomonas sp. Red32 TaxID=2912856 RepID=UPI00202CF180|nr:ABC transporter substrate binding protein [Geomonas sp. Red32]MCM0081703.1 ABC transporter substrate-binding protein [Geomonas sp. Red32]
MPVLRAALIAVLLLLPLPALAYDILVLQSLHEKGYDEAVRGARRGSNATMRTLVLSDYVETDITRIIREEHPRVIIAVGERALAVAEKARNVPVLYMMALNPRIRQGVTGVAMLLDPSRYLSVFNSMGVQKVGVIYDPNRSGAYLRRAQFAARRAGIELITREVRVPKETPAVLESLRGKVEALWMIPDVTAVSPASTEAYFLFSQSQGVPVVTFAEVYLSMGGAVSLGIDRYDIGKQVGEMAESLLAGTPIDELPPQSPRKALTRTNDGVLRRLKISGTGG